MKRLLNFKQWINEASKFTLISGTAAAHDTALNPNSPFTLEDQGDMLIVTSPAVISTPSGQVTLAKGEYDAITIKNMAAKAHAQAGAQYVHTLEPRKNTMASMQVEDPGFTPANIPPGE